MLYSAHTRSVMLQSCAAAGIHHIIYIGLYNGPFWNINTLKADAVTWNGRFKGHGNLSACMETNAMKRYWSTKSLLESGCLRLVVTMRSLDFGYGSGSHFCSEK